MIKKGFSIAEMMVVMLILSIVLAAAIPIITKRVIARANETTTQASSVPVGTVIWYAAQIPPDGFLECNGQSTAGHAELAAIVGSNVPDLRGEFIRGWDHGRGIDTGREFNNSQVDSVNFGGGTAYIPKDLRWHKDWYDAGNGSIFYGFINYLIITSTNETRPRNISLLPCIKY